MDQNQDISDLMTEEEKRDIKESGKSKKKKKKFDPWYDQGDNFVPPILAQYLMTETPYIYDRNTLYYYRNGYYQPDGDRYIKSRSISLMGDDYRDRHGTELARYVENMLWNPNHILDREAAYINLENGVLDWMANPPQLLPHNPKYLTSIRIPIHYDPNATCPEIEQFLAEVLPDDCLDLAYEIFGYCLIPNTQFQKAFMLTGEGDNGKSVFLTLLQAFIGAKNCCAESIQDLADNRFRIASLVGKLVNIFPDLSSKPLDDTSIFKALVSGDVIAAERKGEQSFELKNYARMIFSANKLPPTKDLSHGFFKRWCIIRFPNQFPEGSPKRDPAKQDKVTRPAELSGLLNLAISGLVRLFTQRAFSKPQSTERQLQGYRYENDNVLIFFDECCQPVIGAKISKDQLYSAYEKWCDGGGFRNISRMNFNKHIKTMFPHVTEDTNGIRKWIGIALNESEHPETAP